MSALEHVLMALTDKVKAAQTAPPVPPFLELEDYFARAGTLPAALVELHRFAEGRDLRGAMRTLEYWRPRQEWAPPVGSDHCPLFHALFRDWNGINAFGNLQIWEQLGGLATLGTDGHGNRYFVGTLREEAPVFWMDHESEHPGLHRVIAPSLQEFIGAELAPRKPPSRGRRPRGYEAMCKGIAERWTWPPYLLARSEWMIELIAYGRPVDVPGGQFAADFEEERPLLGGNRSLGLYWLVRSFLDGDRARFDEVAGLTSGSPTVDSAIVVLSSEWSLGDGESRFCAARAARRAT